MENFQMLKKNFQKEWMSNHDDTHLHSLSTYRRTLRTFYKLMVKTLQVYLQSSRELEPRFLENGWAMLPRVQLQALSPSPKEALL